MVEVKKSAENGKRKAMRSFVMRHLSFVILLVSCEKQGFLDATQSTDLDERAVFADSAYVLDFLTGLYTDIGFATRPRRFGGGGLDASTDEAEGAGLGAANTFVQFATGTVNANMVAKDAWSTCYTQIRRANIMLKNLPEAKFLESVKVRVKAETRFLRAYYYFILLEHYGGVPLMGDRVYDAGDDIPSLRSTFEECVDYIAKECDAAAEDLPWAHSGVDYGRISKAACLGLKSRLLLYAASPLFNGEGMASEEPLRSIVAYPDRDDARWTLAEQAAEQVMQSGQYSLHVDNATEPGFGFYEVFQLRKNSEYILAKMQEANRDLEATWNPPTYGVSSPGAYPYLETVNAFGMINGLSIDDPLSGYDPTQPYRNRDPRFYNSITYDQSLVFRWQISAGQPVDIFIDRTNPDNVTSSLDAVYKGTPTGYYVRKMVHREVAAGFFLTVTARCLPIIRYAEILLNYAEARNERLAAPDQEVYKAVEAIRERAGLLLYALPPGLSKEAMRAVIRNERQKELAFEGHRFFDVRRWKIAETVENRQMHGTEPVRTANGTTYNTIDVRKRTFDRRMYLWPIPQSETAKFADLLQNPGY